MIAVGVDTHKHEHVAAALNELGELLGEIVVAAEPGWLPRADEVVAGPRRRCVGRD
jgi:hypothetical protein